MIVVPAGLLSAAGASGGAANAADVPAKVIAKGMTPNHIPLIISVW
jgi:hypothetical protein